MTLRERWRTALGRVAGLVLTLGICAAAAFATPPPLLTDARVEIANGADLPSALRVASARREPVWVGWAVPMVGGQGEVCCYDRGSVRGCRLEQSGSGFSMNDSRSRSGAPELVVLIRWQESRPRVVRVADNGCALDAGAAGDSGAGRVAAAVVAGAEGRSLKPPPQGCY